MKKILVAADAACAMVLAATAAAALQPGVYDPGNTGCVSATYAHGVLHLAKNCPTPTNAAAGADITGFTGQTFQSASFTLANASQCQGGSPRFDVVAAAALVFAATAAAALEPNVFDPGHTGCVSSSYSNGVLHLAKNCPTATNAAAQADITGLTGQTFQSASFTLASASQCQGGSPRFNIVAGGTTYFLGCNNVTPTINADGTATYVFTSAALAAAGLPVPTGAITTVQVLIDVQGTADISNIVVNGTLEKPVAQSNDKAAQCKHGGWKALHFRNQGQCVSHMVHALKHHPHGK